MDESQTQFRLAAFTSFLGLVSCVLMWIGFTRCNFVESYTSFGAWHPSIAVELGLWRSCGDHSDYLRVDPTWKAARAFGVLAAISGTALPALGALSANGSVTIGLRGWEYLLSGIFQALTFLMLRIDICKNGPHVNDDDDSSWYYSYCYISAGSEFVIGAAVVSSLAACASMQLKPPASEAGGPPGSTEPLVENEA